MGQTPSLLLGALTLMPALGQGQSVIYYHDGENSSDGLGHSVSGAGDVDLDGVSDFVVSTTGYDVDPDGTPGSGDELSAAGRVYVYSGKDGTTLWTRDGETGGGQLGWAVSDGGDVNLDGTTDILATAFAYASDPDGTPGSGDEIAHAGRVYVLSGKDGATLNTFVGENAEDFLGRSVSGAGDVNADGVADILAAASGFDADPDGTPGSGDELSDAARVYVYSGFDGTTLYTFDGENAGDILGWSVSDVGDLNLDGFDDIVAGALEWDADPLGPDGTINTLDDVRGHGRVYAYSGKDGTTLWTRDGENGGVKFIACCGGLWFDDGDQLGGGVSRAGDVNGDGTPDIVAGASGFDVDPDGTPGSGDEIIDTGRVYVYSGKDGSTLYAFDGENGVDRLGAGVSGVGDVNGDGTPDILAGAIGWDADPLGPDGTAGTGDEVLTNGRAYVISGAPLSLTADKHLLSLSVANSQTMTIDAGVANAGKNYWLFTGFAASGDTPGVTMAPGVVIPLNQPDPLTSFVISLTQLGGGAPTFAGWKSTLDGFGKASPSLNTFGPTPAPLGITLHHAALVYTADGCGTGCDTFQLATNWVPMTTTP